MADSWFYSEAAGYKSIVELAGQYHDSVGHGGNLLLNIAPPTNTTIPETAMKLYAQLGNWSRRCYGEGTVAAPSALATTTAPSVNCSNIKLSLPGGAKTIDRFQIKEELALGQRILAFQILASGPGEQIVLYNGTAVGSAHIALLDKNVTASSVELKITATRGGPATVNLFAVPDPAACWLPRAGGNCTLVPDTLYSGVAFKTLATATVHECCDACRANVSCAVFTAVLGTTWPYTATCKLMGAMTGEKHVTGAFSGSPVR
eukprot:SAG31_NODE_148_length_22511_cov_20.369266_20_plen_261_part_00